MEKTIDRGQRNMYNKSNEADMMGGLQNEI